MSNREQKAYYVALFYLNDQSEDYKVICSCCYLLPRHLEHGLFCLGVTIQMDFCAGGKHPAYLVGLYTSRQCQRFITVVELFDVSLIVCDQWRFQRFFCLTLSSHHKCFGLKWFARWTLRYSFQYFRHLTKTPMSIKTEWFPWSIKNQKIASKLW